MSNNLTATIITSVISICVAMCICVVSYLIYDYNMTSYDNLIKGGYIQQSRMIPSGTYWVKPDSK